MRVARRRTKRSWRTRANGLNSGQDNKCPGSSNIRPDTRKSIGGWKPQTKPRCEAELAIRQGKRRRGRARSQAREEGARQAEKEEEETGELDRRSFRSEKRDFSTGRRTER